MTRPAVAYLQPPGQLTRNPESEHGLTIVGVFADEQGGERTELAQALERIAAGEARTLYVERLRALAGSLGELVALLDRLGAADATLLAADLSLDTGTAAGARTAALLREIDRWAREPEDARRRRGRPGLAAGVPELAERIAQLREGGLSLQRIAEQLNAEGFPTPRGGKQWRPSSVQSALGYRRPRPPAPGAPPPPGPQYRPGAHPGRHRPSPGRSPGPAEPKPPPRP
ncbi:MAG: recombinase family protein [Solirubrobacterales bacterium]|nr:recombinase family protein [Solirubrobacterales bacterium]